MKTEIKKAVSCPAAFVNPFQDEILFEVRKPVVRLAFFAVGLVIEYILHKIPIQRNTARVKNASSLWNFV